MPRMGPLRVFRKRKAAGKCFTRIFRRPLKRVTVCSGTSCLKATKKADWAATPPQMVANLFVDYWLARVVILDNGREGGKHTIARYSLSVRTKQYTEGKQ